MNDEKNEVRPTHCRSCNAEIVFLKTAKGSNMPVNAETYETGDRQFDSKRHISHFATCPAAVQYRKKATVLILVLWLAVAQPAEAFGIKQALIKTGSIITAPWRRLKKAIREQRIRHEEYHYNRRRLEVGQAPERTRAYWIIQGRKVNSYRLIGK